MRQREELVEALEAAQRAAGRYESAAQLSGSITLEREARTAIDALDVARSALRHVHVVPAIAA